MKKGDSKNIIYMFDDAIFRNSAKKKKAPDILADKCVHLCSLNTHDMHPEIKVYGCIMILCMDYVKIST